MKALIDLDQVGMTYQAESGPVEALAAISLKVSAGQFVSLVGPSGCGKSTLLRIVAGLRPATRGAVLLDGRRVTEPMAEPVEVVQRHCRVRPGARQAAAKHAALMVKPIEQVARPGEDRSVRRVEVFPQ